ncbi:hypothetical protein [Afipia sp. DC4300-2b1]|uniref:hypothetical protein n=1 Tax=Afipia sp. DC4300-2b1 TaxID=2804672 RepID=UPI003CF77448
MDEANRKRIIAAWAVALSLIAFLPIFLFQYPGLQDYANHLARAYILQNLDDPIFKHYFSVDYSPVPNLGWDLFALSAGRFMPLEYAGKTFVVLSCVVTVSGCFALNKAIVGRWTLAPLLIFPFVFNTGFNKGFLSFNFGIGVALWAAAWWASLDEDRWRTRLLGATLFSTGLYLIHFYAWACYGIFVLGWSFRKENPGIWNFNSIRRLIGRLTRDGLQALPSALLALLWLNHARSEKTSSVETFRSFQPPYSRISDLDRLIDLGTPFINDVLLVLACIAFFLAIYLSRFRYKPGATIAILLCVLLFFVLPSKIEETNFVTWRIMLAGLFFLVASLDSTNEPDITPFPSFAIMIALITAIISVLHVQQWTIARDSQTTLFRLLEAVPEGSSVFFARDGTTDKELGTRAAGLYHIGAFVVLQRHAIPQSLFTFAGQQPLRYKRLELQNAPERSNTFLPDLPPAFKEAGLDFRSHINKFDYVIIHDDRFWDRKEPLIDKTIEGMNVLSTFGAFRLYKTANAGLASKFSEGH